LARFGRKETKGLQRPIFGPSPVSEVRSPSLIPSKSSKKRRPFSGLGPVRDGNLAEEVRPVTNGRWASRSSAASTNDNDVAIVKVHQNIGTRANIDAADNLLARVVDGRAERRAPFCVAFAVWLSMIALVGLASRPACSRTAT
jgi:hypothetical protein